MRAVITRKEATGRTRRRLQWQTGLVGKPNMLARLAVAAREGRSILPGTKGSKLHEGQPPAAARAERFAAKNAPAGQRQIKTIPIKSVRAGQWKDTSLRQPSPAAPAKNGFGRFMVNAACCVDLFGIYRGSPLLSTPWPWRRPVVAVPIPPCPVTRGRRA